jgi:hypothetical protein
MKNQDSEITTRCQVPLRPIDIPPFIKGCISNEAEFRAHGATASGDALR